MGAADTDTLLNEPTLLHHYTSQIGLLGILASRSVWASHSSFLNDSSEISHALEIAKEIVNVILYSDDYRDVFAWELRTRLNLLPDPDLYITSFSENPDFLSQWRGYCPTGSGLCLGFNMETLRSYCLAMGYRLEQCLYDRKTLSAEIKLLMNECFDRFPKPPIDKAAFKELSPAHQVDFTNRYRESINFGPYKEAADDALSWFCNELVSLAPLFKNEGFHEEAEWRIIISKPPGVKFRVGVSCLIPYTDLKILEHEGMLHQVIVGPNPNIERCYKSTEMVLRANGHNVLVAQSGIPFNNW